MATVQRLTEWRKNLQKWGKNDNKKDDDEGPCVDDGQANAKGHLCNSQDHGQFHLNEKSKKWKRKIKGIVAIAL